LRLVKTGPVSYKLNGSWAYHVALGIFLKHLIDVVEEEQAKSAGTWLVEAVESWRVVACILG
jgi:hypothetical protein